MIHEVRALAIFAKIAEGRSFRAAARSLGLSPSVVSQQLSALEERLGVALVYRSTRTLSLTPDGEALLKSAQTIVSEAEKGLAQLSNKAPEPIGTLKLAAPEAMVLSPLAEAIASFSDTYPKVKFDVSFTDERLDLVREGFDLAIRVGWLADSSLMAKKIADFPRILLASAGLVEKLGLPRSPDDLRDWPFVRFGQHRSIMKLHRDGFEPIEIFENHRITASSAIGVYRLALLGAGATVTGHFIAGDDLKAGRVVELLPEWQVSAVGMYAVWPPNVPKNGLAMRFVAHCETVIKGRS